MSRKMSIYDLLINPLGWEWDRDFYKFNRDEKDMYPYSITYNEEEKKAIISHNVLGINKEDLSIFIKREEGANYIVISGETKDKITERIYNVSSRFRIPENYDLDNIEAEVKNGLVYITIPIKEEQLPKDTTITINIK